MEEILSLHIPRAMCGCEGELLLPFPAHWLYHNKICDVSE